jgi:hypothetical protein
MKEFKDEAFFTINEVECTDEDFSFEHSNMDVVLTNNLHEYIDDMKKEEGFKKFKIKNLSTSIGFRDNSKGETVAWVSISCVIRKYF